MHLKLKTLIHNVKFLQKLYILSVNSKNKSVKSVKSVKKEAANENRDQEKKLGAKIVISNKPCLELSAFVL